MIWTRPFRKPFWLINSFFSKHRRLIITVAIVVILALLASQNLLAFLPKIRPSEKIGLVGQYQLTNLPRSVVQSLGRSLISVTPSGEIQPDIAADWEILENETLYRIHLQPGIAWSDGFSLVSEDIKLEIPGVAISHPDPLIIEFKLQESFSPFLATLTRPLIKNNRYTVGNWIISAIKFNGPYLSSIALSDNLVNRTYRFYPSTEAAWIGFKRGEINRLENIITNPLDDRWAAKLKVTPQTNFQQYLAIIFNLQHSQLSGKSLRQALAYSIKEKSFTKEDRAFGPINPLSWTYNPNLKPYDYNPNQAQELFGKTEASNSSQLEITLGTSQTFLGLAETIAADWEAALNIKVNVKIISSIEPDFDAILVAQDIPFDPDQHALWHSTQPSNLTHYSDLKIDKLLEDGRKISDPKKRQEIYRDFQRFLVEDTPAIFLRYPTTYTISRH